MNDLIHGDCLSVMANIATESVDLVVTDCPYKIVAGGCTIANSGGKKRTDWNADIITGKMFKHNDIKFDEWLLSVYRVLKQQSHCYIMVNSRNLAELQKQAEKVGFIFQNLLIWDKGNVTPNRYYMQGFECILMLRKGNAKNINNLGCSNILRIPNSRNKNHPTEKPIELMKILIENSSNENDVVLDPFIGSGAVAVAAIQLNRGFIGIELDEEYYTIAKDRILSELL